LVTLLITFLVTVLRLQTGVRVEADVWRAYRAICKRDKQRPSRPIEEFLRLIVESDSALSLLRLMREASRFRVDGHEAYVLVLLDWYTHGKFWIEGLERNVSVEYLLLDALKLVADADLRQRIEEALIAHQRSVGIKKQYE
jgi:hypothetical protein